MTDPTPDVAARAAAELAEMLQHCPPGTVTATERLMHTIDEGYRLGVPDVSARADAALSSARTDAILDELGTIRVELEQLRAARTEPQSQHAGRELEVRPGIVPPQRAAAIREEVTARIEVRALEQADAEIVTVLADYTRHPAYTEAAAPSCSDE